jgi:hypothetical protein
MKNWNDANLGCARANAAYAIGGIDSAISHIYDGFTTGGKTRGQEVAEKAITPSQSGKQVIFRAPQKEVGLAIPSPNGEAGSQRIRDIFASVIDGEIANRDKQWNLAFRDACSDISCHPVVPSGVATSVQMMRNRAGGFVCNDSLNPLGT